VIAVRALTGIAVSLLVGVILVALVWLADALHIPPAEGVTVQEALRLASKYAELPQWWWIGICVLMAATSVLFTRVYPQPRRLPVESTLSLLAHDDTRA
jgi:hypothetical protein